MLKKHLIISRKDIEKRVRELGREITRDYQGCDLVLIGILNGAFIFVADLVRRIDLDLKVDFVRLASYGDKTEAGEIRFTKDIELPLAGRDLLVVEDIIDTGGTIACIKNYLAGHKPNSVKICTLIDKQEGDTREAMGQG